MRVSKNTNLKPLSAQSQKDKPYPLVTPIARSRSAYDENDALDFLSWERFRSTFSNKKALQNLPKTEPLHYPENCTPVCTPQQKVSSTATQVNIDHCTDCRRHRKYGKPLRDVTFESSCESESSQAEDTVPMSIRKRDSRRLSRKRDAEICHNKTGWQEESSDENDKEQNTLPANICGEILLTDDETCNSRRGPVTKQAYTDYKKENFTHPKVNEMLNSALNWLGNKDENFPQTKLKGMLNSSFQWLSGSLSPIVNITLIFQLLVIVSGVLLFLHSDILHSILPASIGTYFGAKEKDVPNEETYLKIFINCFSYLFSTTKIPVSYISLF